MQSSSALDHAKALCSRAGLDINDVASVHLYPGNEVFFLVHVRSEAGTKHLHECSVNTCGGVWPFYCPKHNEPETDQVQAYLA